MANRQYVAAVFRAGDRRSYTYHNDGAPVAIGDQITVDTAKGMATLTVTGLPGKPEFATKPIIGKAGEPKLV